jgi:hypothetical protein
VATATHPKPVPAISALDVFLSTMAIFSFAVAQPLLDTIGRAPEFFAAHDLSRLEILTFAVLIVGVLPGLGALALALLWRANPRAGGILHLLTLTFLTAVLLLQVVKQLFPSVPSSVMLVGAVGAAVATCLAYVRVAGVRAFFRLGAAASVVFLLLFIFVSSTAQVLFANSPSSTHVAPVQAARPAPVMIVVFDELPLNSLMTPAGAIDAAAFPAFASLAADGTWFRNATTVHDFTTQSIPAILSGRRPRNSTTFPSAANHPNTLFSLFAKTYEIKAFETATLLCQFEECGTTTRLPLRARWKGLAEDLSVVSQHLFLPPNLTRDLPPLDETFGNFAARLSGSADDELDRGRHELRRQRARNTDPLVHWRELISSIAAPSSPTPAFYFLHSMLTHRPWVYSPTGQRYRLTNIPGKTGTHWEEDEWLITQSQQRHLIQVAFADQMLGQALRRLKDVGLYNDALVIVTADHGISFGVGQSLRSVYPQTVGEIAAIPLFVKRPAQTVGRIDERRVETVDIVPSVADVLGVELPFETDGRSFFAGDEQLRTESEILGQDAGRLVLPTSQLTSEPLRRKFARFEPGLEGMFRIVPNDERPLLGMAAPSGPHVNASVAISRLEQYDDVRADAASIPSRIAGTIKGLGAGPHTLAVSMNMKIAAVTRTFTRDGEDRFFAMLPPGSLQDGRNSVQVFRVRREGGAHALEELSVVAGQ